MLKYEMERVTDLLTVLVCYDGTTRRSRICAQADTFLLASLTTPELESDNGSTRRSSYPSQLSSGL